ncbi:MAG: hypothetical protein IJ943_08830 [Akkermansia sp.]|nr:hypothetical protein [Akkermansia sp.]
MKLIRIALPLTLLVGCSTLPDVSDWQAEPLPVSGVRPVVPTYEVEFLPVVPTIPGTLIVGRFRILNNAVLPYDNEDYVQAVKQLAAQMGGNTIVYAGSGQKEAVVAYVPLETVNYHGGDEALFESGVLSEDF